MATHPSSLRQIELMSVFQHIDGNMYTVPVLQNGDTASDPLRSKLIVCENGQPLRQRHENHSTIVRTGRGAYSHWERHLLFSTSDNTDPNKNGRVYSYAVDHLNALEVHDNGISYLNPPFIFKKGLCWTVAVLPYGDDVTTGDTSKLVLLEDSRSLGPSHASHDCIVLDGAGAYSHWHTYLYFSTTDGSDPNTNGRLYSYRIEE